MNVSSVKNLNGETFSAVQDAYLTDVVSNNSANWNEISAYQANSGNYQLTADMTAYANSAEVTGTAQYGLTTAGWSEITGGGDVPEGVMVESGLEYNAVNEISGYNGSAIAQYGAEKQWLVHDDTLVHAANSAQYALGVNVSAVQTLMGLDETVLWNGSTSGTTGNVDMSEVITNFERIGIFYSMNHAYLNGAYNFGGKWLYLDPTDLSITQKFNINDFFCDGVAANTMVIRNDIYTVSNDFKTLVHDIATQMFFNGTSWSVNTTQHATIYKVIGIGRKQ